MSDDPTDRTNEDPFEEVEDDHDADPFGEVEDDSGSLFTGPDGTDEADADPFAELDDEGGLPEGDGDPFERMEVDEVDVDGVWDALEEDLEDPDGDVAVSGRDPREATDHVVDKRTYCHRCPHFAEPPETACTHEDASILEAIGFDEFRVRDCPMVTDEGPRFDRHGRLDE